MPARELSTLSSINIHLGSLGGTRHVYSNQKQIVTGLSCCQTGEKVVKIKIINFKWIQFLFLVTIYNYLLNTHRVPGLFIKFLKKIHRYINNNFFLPQKQCIWHWSLTKSRFSHGSAIPSTYPKEQPQWLAINNSNSVHWPVKVNRSLNISPCRGY